MRCNVHFQYYSETTSTPTPVCAVIPPPLPENIIAASMSTEQPLDLSTVMLPHVILWDLLSQYLATFSGGLVCSQCSQSMFKQYWKLGQSDGKQPRVIHSLEHTVLVVSAVYGCHNQHTMSATDPSIVNMLNVHQQPYALLHRTGLTRFLVRSVIRLFSGTVTISAIESYIIKSRKEYAATLLMQVKIALAQHAITYDQQNLDLTYYPLALIQTPFPSNDVICKCILVDFFENRPLYDAQMCQLSARTHISFDHTFKIASNIGFLRADRNGLHSTILFFL